MNFFGNVSYLQKAMDVSTAKQRVISNNIANVETPGYKTMEVSFAGILANEQTKTNNLNFQGYQTHPAHFQIGHDKKQSKPKIEVQDKYSLLNNENNVDIEYEMTKLAENNIWYSTLSQVMNKEFSKLRYVITEGRR